MSMSRRPLKVGLYIPNGVGYMSGGVHSWTDVLGFARAAETAGFDSIWVADHMLFRMEGETETQGRWECWSLLAALATVTKRVEIGPLVSCLSFRNPALLAKIAETVDEISNGRLILAVGAGWHEPEYLAYGFPYDHRASRFEEGFAIVHDLIKTGAGNFHGVYERVTDCEIRPRGPRPDKIPLIVGTNGDRLLKLAASKADGWNTTWISDPAEVRPLRLAVDAACEAVGRDPKTLSRSACIYVDLPDRVRRFPRPDPLLPARDPEGVVELLHAYAAEGLDHVMVWLDPNSLAGIETFSRTLELIDRG
jgi:alkanesulfonate monooxygenase SsuD/methylene tetrahydromethanopterin reductase-like flavin-dependent oxidoreductase (luciferase family)